MPPWIHLPGYRARLVLWAMAGVLGATLGAPELGAQDTGSERIASIAPSHRAHRDAVSPRIEAPAPAEAEAEAATDTEAEADEPTGTDAMGPEAADEIDPAVAHDYESLRRSLPASAAHLEPVVLADHLPLSWWSEVTDSWLLEPARQRRRMPHRCRTRGGYREHCSGERIVPEPSPAAAALADYFGLGERGTAMVMMHRESFPEWMALVEGLDDETRLTFPVPTGHMGRGFGFTRTGELRRRRHQGVDIGAPEGSTIVAARGGLVVFSDNAITGYGNMVMILHPDGDSTFYAHCRATFVAAGELVTRGQRIAEVGETGFAGGPHLHFELRRNGWSRDPRRRFLRRDTTDASVEVAVATAADTDEDDVEPGDVDEP